MEAYSKVKIYFFSGTGNSRNVALWFKNVAQNKNVECEVVNIVHTDINNIEKNDDNTLIVFTSPVHGFNYPPVMLHFIRCFPKGKNNVILMNTRAGMLIGKWVTPGLSGIAFYLSALLLWLKGYHIQAMFPVDMPSNWISVHPGLNDRTIKFLHEKNKQKVIDFAGPALGGKSNFKSLREIIQDLLIAPIALIYYCLGRFIIAKTYYASADCNNCGLCIKECPVGAIKKVDNRPFWSFKCESCMKCMSHCPKKAIETAHGFFAGVLILNSSFVIGLFYKYFDHFFFTIKSGWVNFLIKNILLFLLLVLSYRIMHFLLRFKFFERIIVYTSLTKYKFWGRRYKALKQ